MRLTKIQKELLGLLALGPRYGFTRMTTINSLVEKGLARKKGADWIITSAGRKLLPPQRPFNQHTSQDTPGFVETFRVSP